MVLVMHAEVCPLSSIMSLSLIYHQHRLGSVFAIAFSDIGDFLDAKLHNLIFISKFYG